MQDNIVEKQRACLLVDADSIYFKAEWRTKKKQEISKIIDNHRLEIKHKFCSPVLTVAVTVVNHFRNESYEAN